MTIDFPIRNKKLERTCPICNGTIGLILMKLDFCSVDQSPLSSRFDLVSCSKCGMVYYDTLCDTEKILEYYKEISNYDSSVSSGSGGVSSRDLKNYADLLQLLEPYFSKTSHIIDVGCASGGFLGYLKKHGYVNGVGVEPSPGCVQSMKSDGLSALEGDTGNIPQESKTVDCIVYSHVWEHLYSFDDVFTEAERVLTKDGVIYFEVPDATAYDTCNSFGFYDEHVNHFERTTLIQLVERNNFTVIKSGVRTVDRGNGLLEQCLYGIAKRGAARSTEKFEIHAPQILHNYLSGFISEWKLLSRKIIESDRKVYVWGVSSIMSLLLGTGKLKHSNIVSFSDKDLKKQRFTINGVPIESPDILTRTDSDDIVVVSPGQWSSSMVEWYNNNGGKAELIVPNIFDNKD